MAEPAPTKEEYLVLPFEDEDHWSKVLQLGSSELKSLDDLLHCMKTYCQVRSLHGLKAALRLSVDAMDTEEYAITEEQFLRDVLPVIVRRALDLPSQMSKLGKQLPILTQMVRKKVHLPRELGASLLANMFLCTFDHVFDQVSNRHEMPEPSFYSLHSRIDRAPQEEAKLRMFIHFFHRIGDTPMRGEVVIDRVVGVDKTHKEWLASDRPLMEMEMAERFASFESRPDLAHADFANRYIGGGVLCGGCVQEEIRFAICPELCLSLLLCPCMLDREAVQIIGTEQFSAYSGYAFKLRFAGPHEDTARRDESGSLQTAVFAMDALDLRGYYGHHLQGQMEERNIDRELNKALAAFCSDGVATLEQWPMVATGNWGCGVFGGFAPLKALLQWASASECGRKIRYFPYEQEFGDELLEHAKRAVSEGATVGQLLRAVDRLAKGSVMESPSTMLSAAFENLSRVMTEEKAGGTGGTEQGAAADPPGETTTVTDATPDSFDEKMT